MVSCSSTKTLVVLLPDENSPDGAVAIEKGDRTTILNEPISAVEVNARGRVEKVAMTDGEVEEVFSRALAFQPPETISFLLYFEEGTTVVVPGSRKTLTDLFEEVAKRQAVEVQVTGHTDTVGNLLDNDVLSQERAQTIKGMLVQKGLQSDFIRAVGRGERELLIPTQDNVCEPKNRRVQVIVR
jgi:outer membrane protein OmpA-like peptidoglycan-associated protein